MTAEEIVMNGYAAFGSGDMEALGKIYHMHQLRLSKNEYILETYSSSYHKV